MNRHCPGGRRGVASHGTRKQEGRVDEAKHWGRGVRRAHADVRGRRSSGAGARRGQEPPPEAVAGLRLRQRHQARHLPAVRQHPPVPRSAAVRVRPRADAAPAGLHAPAGHAERQRPHDPHLAHRGRHPQRLHGPVPRSQRPDGHQLLPLLQGRRHERLRVGLQVLDRPRGLRRNAAGRRAAQHGQRRLRPAQDDAGPVGALHPRGLRLRRRRERERRAREHLDGPQRRHDQGLRAGLAGVERGAGLQRGAGRHGGAGPGADGLRRLRRALRPRRRPVRRQPQRQARRAPRRARRLRRLPGPVRREGRQPGHHRRSARGEGHRGPADRRSLRPARLPGLRRHAREGLAGLRRPDAGGRRPGHLRLHLRRPRQPHAGARVGAGRGRLPGPAAVLRPGLRRLLRPPEGARDRQAQHALRLHRRRERPLRRRRLEPTARGATRSATSAAGASACPANQIGEVNANLAALLPGGEPSFQVHSDSAPTVYVNGNPPRTDAALRKLERDVAATKAVDPYVSPDSDADHEVPRRPRRRADAAHGQRRPAAHADVHAVRQPRLLPVDLQLPGRGRRWAGLHRLPLRLEPRRRDGRHRQDLARPGRTGRAQPGPDEPHLGRPHRRAPDDARAARPEGQLRAGRARDDAGAARRCPARGPAPPPAVAHGPGCRLQADHGPVRRVRP